MYFKNDIIQNSIYLKKKTKIICYFKIILSKFILSK